MKNILSNIEIWKDIYGFKNKYQISNLGRVRSLDRYVKGKNNSSCLRKGKILKNKLGTNGYYFVHLNEKCITKCKSIHRLVCETFVKCENLNLEVNHIDGNKLNNYLNNLEWVTRNQNIKHSFDIKIRHPNKLKRNKCHFTKIKTEHIKEIKTLRLKGYTNKYIANIYNVHESTIEKVFNKIKNNLL